MPARTRSKSAKLKRKRDEMEQADPEEEELAVSKEEEQPRRKKQKLNNEKKVEDKENDNDIDNKSKKKTTTKKKKVANKKRTNEFSEADKKEMIRLKAKEKELSEAGYKCIVGVDEAGRGPLAGPVVVSAAWVPFNINIEGITDSKKINEEHEREKLYEIIMGTKEIKYSVAVLDHEVIDEHNILEASLLGMRQCVTSLHDQLIESGHDGVDYALCDGNRDPKIEYPEHINYEYIIKGDGNVYCIGAASIIAKVTRDRLMAEYDAKYPGYGFLQHKGYPTPSHKALVWSKGPCPIHRKSFKPVKDWYKENKPSIHKKWEDLKKKAAEERKKKLSTKKKGENEKKGKNKKAQPSITDFFGGRQKKKENAKKGKGKKKKVGKKKKKKQIEEDLLISEDEDE